MKPVESFFAHPRRQHGDAAATEDAGDRDPPAAKVASRGPDCLVVLRVEPPGDHARNKAAIRRQHLVGFDQRKKAAEGNDDRGANPGQLRRQEEVRRDCSEPGAGLVIVPVHAKEIGRMRAVRLGGAKRRDPRFPNGVRVGKLGKGRQPDVRPTQPPRRTVANGDVDDGPYHAAIIHDAVSPHPSLQGGALRRTVIAFPAGRRRRRSRRIWPR